MRDRIIATGSTAANLERRQQIGMLRRKAFTRILPYLPNSPLSTYEPSSVTGELELRAIQETTHQIRSTLSDQYLEFLYHNIEQLKKGKLTLMNRSINLCNQFPKRVPPSIGEKQGFPRQWTLKLLSVEPAMWIALSSVSDKTELAKSLVNWVSRWNDTEITNFSERGSHRRYWSPYTVSRRICNLALLAGVLDSSEIKKSDILYLTLWRDSNYLANHVEYDIGGNHIIENACALLIGGVVLCDTELIDQGYEILLKELPNQLLEDGMHFEKSPMYHAILLYQLSWTLRVVQYSGYNDLAEIKPYLQTMYECLHSIAPGEANYPLLNDSVYNECPHRNDCLSLAEEVFGFSQPTMNSLGGGSGYFMLQSGDLSMVIDGGNPGPKHLPGHSHNDVGNFVLWLEEEPVIVDSGVYDYQRGERRDYARSVRAHNTIQVANADQAVTHGRFKMGPRPNPSVNYIRKPDEQVRIDFNSPYFITNYRHIRNAKIIDDGFLVLDEILSGETSFTSRLHLSPHASASIHDNEINVVVSNKQQIKILISGVDTIQIVKTKYYPEYGIEVTRPTIEAKMINAQDRRKTITHKILPTCT